MRNKLFIPVLSIIWITAYPYPSWTGGMKAGDPTATPLPQSQVRDKPANPSVSPSKTIPGTAPETNNLDPESQIAPALRIQEGTNTEG